MAEKGFARVALLAIAALLSGVFAGCGKDGASVVSEEPKSRMKDPAYVAELGKARDATKGIAARRWAVVERMQAIVEKAKAEGKEPPDYPEWAALAATNEALIAEFQVQNRKSQELVRERIRRSMIERRGKDER